MQNIFKHFQPKLNLFNNNQKDYELQILGNLNAIRLRLSSTQLRSLPDFL